MSKTNIMAELRHVAPSIAFSVTWEHDDDFDGQIFQPGFALHGDDPDDWQQWQTDVGAVAIIGGEFVEGHAYLGGTWEKFGDDPATANPTISGYLPQMLHEAVTELANQLPNPAPMLLLGEIEAARAYLVDHMRDEYDRQQDARP